MATPHMLSKRKANLATQAIGHSVATACAHIESDLRSLGALLTRVST